jgi:hypothetical protein
MKLTHLKPIPCRCSEPFGDEREMTCGKCGRQVNGKPIPEAGVIRGTRDHTTFAKATRKYRPAA